MVSNYDIEARRKAKMRSDDRILILEQIPGTKGRNAAGNVDPRIFTGENKLHVIYSEVNGMWKFQYEQGGLPEVLKQNFTTFTEALAEVTKYFAKRNIRVAEVID